MPGELLHENMISSYVKISLLLRLHKLRLSHQKSIRVKWFGTSLVFLSRLVQWQL